MGKEAEEAWIEHAATLAKKANTRSRAFDDPSLISRVVDTVKKNATRSSDSNGVGQSSGRPLSSPSGGLESDQHHQHPNLQQDWHDYSSGGSWGETGTKDFSQAFDAPPPEVSPLAARSLCRVFTFLRNSSAGCPANNKALRHTGLAEAALQLAVDQAPFACGAVYSYPAATMDCNEGVEARVERASGVRLALRAGLQFACNYCVGSEENKASLWAKWFPRGLMELVNGLKTDRGLLSLAVALIHNCCLSPPPCERRGHDESDGGSRREHAAKKGVDGEGEKGEGGGRQRLGCLVADRAFCCLLMKVVVPQSASSNRGGGGGVGGTSSSHSHSDSGGKLDHDPAAEWLYLLFCSIVQEGLCRNVYDNVGIRAGGRQQEPRRRLRQNECGVVVEDSSTEKRAVEGGREEDGTLDAGSSARVTSGAGQNGEENMGGEEEEDEGAEEDFFFPVTPEQLIALNLAEIAAGDEVVTGGEHPTPQQRQACCALVAWLGGLLSAMPLSQTLLPRTGAAPTPPAVKQPAVGQPQATPSSSPAQKQEEEDDVDDHIEVADVETERVRRSMREEARSAVLRALAALLAGCGAEVRQRTAAMGTGALAAAEAAAGLAAQDAEPASAAIGSGDEGECARAAMPRDLRGVNGRGESVPPSFTAKRVVVQHETRLVPLCLRLLDGCGGAAEPKPNTTSGSNASSAERSATTAATSARAAEPAPDSSHREVPAGGTLRVLGGVPAGRKVELLKVIGSACFRCRGSQDLVREEGGLALVLNHCAVDDANPLLREYALLAVRNLCEGNPTNQAAIASLQPQGRTPGMDKALADMGLQGYVNSKGQFGVGPRPPTSL